MGVGLKGGGVEPRIGADDIGDDELPPRLMDEGIPSCAVTTLDDLHVISIADTGHLS